MDEIILPGVFSRALEDDWHFGLLLDNGEKIAISRINNAEKDSFGNVWLDVELNENDFEGYISSPTTRTNCTINLSKIQAIYELADT